jgi:hypothetical protein
MPTYTTGQVPNCPHCGKPQDEVIEDYVVQGPRGKMNYPYENDCGYCDGLYDVTKTGADTYEVSAKPGTR